MARQPHIGENLRLMEARKRLDGFHFNDHAPVDQKVEAIGALQPEAFIDNGQGNLTLHRQPTSLKLVG